MFFCRLNKKVSHIILLILLIFSANQFCLKAQRIENEKIVLQLKWKNQFQFAGYYAAIEKGFYKEVGLDVEVRELEKSSNPTEIVMSGLAQYGIGNSELVIQYMQGLPIVVIACILQNSPSAIVVKANSNINTPKDFINKKIEINKDESGIEIMAMLLKEGVSSDQINAIESTFSLNNLLSNKIDALEIYTSNEPFFLTKFGIPFRLIYPRNYGINFYSDCLFTTRDEIEKHPERVKKFRQASLKGWKYALTHQEEVANIIQSKYKSIKTLDHLLYEAEEIRRLAVPEFVQMGHTNKERWLNIVETLSQQGLITNLRDINDFVYDPEEESLQYEKRFYLLVIIISALAILFLGYLNYKTKINLLKRTKELSSLTRRYESQIKEINRIKSENGHSNTKSL
ncbi:MAG: ABC transporter substrate-binding protein [Tenuifilaceae bacterium]